MKIIPFIHSFSKYLPNLHLGQVLLCSSDCADTSYAEVSMMGEADAHGSAGNAFRLQSSNPDVLSQLPYDWGLCGLSNTVCKSRLYLRGVGNISRHSFHFNITKLPKTKWVKSRVLYYNSTLIGVKDRVSRDGGRGGWEMETTVLE